MSASERSKGRRGQLIAQQLLKSRDWAVAELNSGTATEDFIATDPDGNQWAVEVKNTKAITTEHRTQAMTQARSRKLPWMLMSHIDGTASWLVQRKGCRPVVWSNWQEEQACA